MSEENLEELYLDKYRDLNEKIKDIANDLHSNIRGKQEKGKRMYKELYLNEKDNPEEMVPFFLFTKKYLYPSEIPPLLEEIIMGNAGGASKAYRIRKRRTRSKARRSKERRSKARRSKARKKNK